MTIKAFSRPGIVTTASGQTLRREKLVAAHIPFYGLIRPDTVLLRNGALMQTLALEGFPYETADDDALSYRKNIFSGVLKANADGRFAVWSHLIRRKTWAYPGGNHPAGFAQRLDRAWENSLRAKSLFNNRHYLSLIRRSSAAGALSSIYDWTIGLSHHFDKRARQIERIEMQEALDSFTHQILETLADYAPTKLSSSENYSDLLAFLSMLVNLDQRTTGFNVCGLNALLPRYRQSFGPRYGVIGDKRIAMISLKEYSDHTYSGMLDMLLNLPHEYILTQTFEFADRSSALGWMRRHKGRLHQSGDEAEEFVSGVKEAANDLATGRVCHGYSHTTVMPIADNVASLKAATDAIRGVFDHAGLISVVEDIGAEPARWAQLPGNRSYIARNSMISSRNFACLSSLHNQPKGQISGNHWGDALTMLETTGGSPYFFSFHPQGSDVGHTTITGVTGAGKTTLVMFLLAQSLKFGGLRVFFDKDRGAEIGIRALGGQYTEFKPGMPTGFNPLALTMTDAYKQFLYDFLRLLLSKGGLNVFSDQDELLIADVVKRIETLEPKDRRLRNIAPFFGVSHMQNALAKWINDGIYSWVFDNPADTLDFGADKTVSVIGFEMGQLLDNADIRTVTMAYLNQRTQMATDGRPLIKFLEEGWRLLDDPWFEGRMKDDQLTLRKKNGFNVFLIQHPSLAIDHSNVGRLLFQQSPTKIFFPDGSAKKRIYIDEIGLSERQYDLIKTTAKESHLFLVLQERDAVLARLDLSGMDDIIAVLSGRTGSVNKLDAIRAQVGDDPNAWMPLFNGRQHANAI